MKVLNRLNNFELFETRLNDFLSHLEDFQGRLNRIQNRLNEFRLCFEDFLSQLNELQSRLIKL